MIRPKNNYELRLIIQESMIEMGDSCDLNFIDVSLITDLSYLFNESSFNGDISQWNTSNVLDMNYMFHRSLFNGDISSWNTSSVTNMNLLFSDSNFKGSVDAWCVDNVQTMQRMFDCTSIKRPAWYIEDYKKRQEYLNIRRQAIKEHSELERDVSAGKDSSSATFKL